MTNEDKGLEKLIPGVSSSNNYELKFKVLVDV